VLDTAQGIPAAGVPLTLHRVQGDTREPLGEFATNRDGRVDSPLLDGDALTAGTYEIGFDVDSYFRSQSVSASDPPFLDVVTVRFTLADADSHYHVRPDPERQRRGSGEIPRRSR
jgi:5-hydroxyisourate hydrolase